jgi:hypothetical protein
VKTKNFWVLEERKNSNKDNIRVLNLTERAPVNISGKSKIKV